MMPPIPIPIYETIDILLDVYAYHHAWRIAEQYFLPFQSKAAIF